jgi:hypothetical protein
MVSLRHDITSIWDGFFGWVSVCPTELDVQHSIELGSQEQFLERQLRI